MATKYYTPDSIVKWKKLTKHAKRIVDTTDHHLRRGYDTAIEEHLMENGKVDMKKLEDPVINEKFAKTMGDFYVSKAKQYFHIKGDLDEFQIEALLNAYADETQLGLKQMVHQHGENFTYQKFRAEKKEFLDKLDIRMRSAAGSHLEDRDIEDIIRYTKAEDIVNPKYVKREDALGLLTTFEESGVVPPKKYVEFIKGAGKDYMLADKYKTKKKAEKNYKKVA